MVKPGFVVWLLSLGMMVTGTGGVSAQIYPTKPIRIVTGGVGGGSDFTARLIAQGISAPLGQQVIVDNRGSGVIPGELVSRAPPDGYTLLVSSSSLWIVPLLQSVPFDPVRDFLPIALTNRAPNILVVHPSLPVKSIKELTALAKARPGELNYSTGSTGASSHLAAELFKVMAGVNMVRIPYKSGATEIFDLLSGQVQLTFGTAASVMPLVKARKLRALAVTSAQPFALAPELPTVAASGLPGYESETVAGIFAPAKTPAAIINRLNQEIVQVLKRADVREKYANTGVEAVGSSPEEFAAKIKSDITRMSKVIKDAGLRAD